MENYIVVLVTYPDIESARKISRQLLDNRLIACANLSANVQSLFRWKDEISEESEVLVIYKTRGDHFEALSKKVQELHPYEVPEVIALPIVNGSKDYLVWIDDET